MTGFQRENRYIVIKHTDLMKAPDHLRHEIMYAIKDANLPERDFVVVESDWPEYELVWQMIEARVTGTNPLDARKVFEQVTIKEFEKGNRPTPSFARAAWGYKDSAIQSAWWGFERGWQQTSAVYLCAQLAERDKMLSEFACEMQLALADSQVRAAMSAVGRTKCLELLQRYNQR